MLNKIEYMTNRTERPEERMCLIRVDTEARTFEWYRDGEWQEDNNNHYLNWASFIMGMATGYMRINGKEALRIKNKLDGVDVDDVSKGCWTSSEEKWSLLMDLCDNHTPITIVFNDEPDYQLDCIPQRITGDECVVIVDEYNNRYNLRPGMDVIIDFETIGDVIVREKATVPPEDYRPMTDEEKEAIRQDMIKAMDEGNFHAWSLFVDSTEDEELQQIQTIMLHMDAFLRSDDTGFADTHMQVSNDPDAKEPEWHRTEDGYSIILCAESGKHWSQVAYQLGYTMMHCLIDHLRPDDEYRIDWVEELICEMASRQLLFEFCRNWKNNPLSNNDPEYENALWDYLDDSFNDHGTSRLSACESLEELKRINALGKRQPEARLEEVYNLYHQTFEDDLLRLAHCRKYTVPGTILLDTKEWLSAEPDSAAVAYICRLQNRIPNTQYTAGTQALFHMEESIPTEAQLDAICDYLLSLREVSGDNIVLQFHDIDKNDAFDGMSFIQACRSDSKEKPFRVEVRVDDGNGYHILAERETTSEQAIDYLRYACLHRCLPCIDHWEDISEEILREALDHEE